MTENIRVFIVEDDKDFIFLIKKMLEKQPEIEVIGSCSKKEEAVQMACALRPQIVIMDLNLGVSEADGIRISREIRLLTDAKVLILTSLDSPDIVLRAAKEAFASGYIFKNQPNLLVENILALARGYTAQEYLIASMALSEEDNTPATAQKDTESVNTAPQQEKLLAEAKTKPSSPQAPYSS